MRAWVESKGSLEGWWFESLKLSVRITKESDAHRGRARRAPRASQTSTAGEPDEHRARIVGEPATHRVRTTDEPGAHQGQARQAPCAP